MVSCDWDPGIIEVILGSKGKTEADGERGKVSFFLSRLYSIDSIRVERNQRGGAYRGWFNGRDMVNRDMIVGARDKATLGILELVVSSVGWILILFFMMRQSHGDQGIQSKIFQFTKLNKGHFYFGKLGAANLWMKYLCGGISLCKITGDKYMIDLDSGEEVKRETREYYIICIALEALLIGSNFFFISTSFRGESLIEFWFSMAQGQLVGSMGELRNGEGTLKRLKITVAHFDNSDLIKSFSRILVGRCMNPPAQEMKALLSNLPKIWKLEDRVIGKDLGLGKFQFEFEKEEDMEGVLKLQPYHFDYWMIAVAKWQPKRSINYPSEIPFWVRVLGVSKEFRTVPTFESI